MWKAESLFEVSKLRGGDIPAIVIEKYSHVSLGGRGFQYDPLGAQVPRRHNVLLVSPISLFFV